MYVLLFVFVVFFIRLQVNVTLSTCKTHYFHSQCERLHEHQVLIIIVIILKHLKTFQYLQKKQTSKRYHSSVTHTSLVSSRRCRQTESIWRFTYNFNLI